MLRFESIQALLANHYLPATEAQGGYFHLSQVSATLAETLSSVLGLPVQGLALLLDRSGVRHTLKQHGPGNAAAEIAQGQVPIDDDDFLALSEWLPKPERVQPGQLRPGKQPLRCIEFYATLPTGRVCAVLEYRPGRKCLALVTMYKKRPVG